MSVHTVLNDHGENHTVYYNDITLSPDLPVQGNHKQVDGTNTIVIQIRPKSSRKQLLVNCTKEYRSNG